MCQMVPFDDWNEVPQLFYEVPQDVTAGGSRTMIEVQNFAKRAYGARQVSIH